MAPQEDDGLYHPVDALKAGTQGALIAGGAGVFAAAIKNATRKTNHGALGVVTHSGGIIFTFTAVGAVFGFVQNASANLRQKKDHYNAGIGGLFAGSIIGMRSGRMPVILGYGAFTAVTLAAFDFCGGSLRGKKPEIEGMDEFERKEYLRTTRRRPIEETIENLGEGRGIKGPGYEERRRQRLQEKYGVEINPVSAQAS
ncbi:hypothetical protein VM1G_08036 [Cytospora mali]|uniref:NADH-ubiquinone oxidoreductase 21.3 kDa subunit n=1 Tax=Cytospora mali TaxID=578113 RepID=A0A194W754_CYTMA|nr:hypothetical protein VM1G_08036 [Valsa mali]